MSPRGCGAEAGTPNAAAVGARRRCPRAGWRIWDRGSARLRVAPRGIGRRLNLRQRQHAATSATTGRSARRRWPVGRVARLRRLPSACQPPRVSIELPSGLIAARFTATSPRIRLGTFLLIAGSPADAHGSCQPGVRLAQRTSHRVPEPRRPRPRREVSLARPLQVSPAVSSSALDRRYQIGYYRDAAALDS